MEIQIFNPTQAQPLPEISWNYAELKQQLEAGLANYKGLATAMIRLARPRRTEPS